MSRAEGFAAIPNWMVRDQNVSVNELAVFASLASRSGLGGIFVSQATIAAELGLSERTVRSVIGQLEQRNVIVRVRRSTDLRGKANRLPDGYELRPDALPELPASVAGSNMQPANDDVATGKIAQSLPLIEVEPVEVEPVRACEVSFEDFWSVWPRKDAKKAAAAAWAKAVKRESPARIVIAATDYAEHPHRPERKFVPHAATWLNGDRWTDPLPEPPALQVTAIDVGRAARDILLRQNTSPAPLRVIS